MVALKTARQAGQFAVFRTAAASESMIDRPQFAHRGVPIEPAVDHAQGVDIKRDAEGQIQEVRISAWRTLVGSPQRRLQDVRELSARRIAVRIERLAEGGDHATSEIWQLYDLDGRLEAAMQTSLDGGFVVMMNYQTREACQLVRNAAGEMELCESWNI